jgi:hypothetical protein
MTPFICAFNILYSNWVTIYIAYVIKAHLQLILCAHFLFKGNEGRTSTCDDTGSSQ